MIELKFSDFYSEAHGQLREALDFIFSKSDEVQKADFLSYTVILTDNFSEDMCGIIKNHLNGYFINNVIYNNKIVPVCQVENNHSDCIVVNKAVLNLPVPEIISDFTYSMYFLYYAGKLKNEIITHDLKMYYMRLAVSYLSDKKALTNFFDFIDFKNYEIRVEKIRESILCAACSNISIPEPVQCALSIIHFCFYIAHLQALKKRGAIPSDEYWPHAETYFSRLFGESYSNLKRIFDSDSADYESLLNKTDWTTLSALFLDFSINDH